MKRCTGTALVALEIALLLCGKAAAGQAVTDVNIVTGLDISYSIDTEMAAAELEGMATALRDPRVMRAIRAGRHQRIGFAVFAWHFKAFPNVVAWTVIASPEDAHSAARTLEAEEPIRLAPQGVAQIPWNLGGFTDLSEAIRHAGKMLQTAPFAADRTIINIVGNGRDNVAEDAGPARDQFVAGGGTINGLVLGTDPVVIEYYREQVIGGRAAFVMSLDSSATIADAFVRKFIGDIVASTESAGPWGSP